MSHLRTKTRVFGDRSYRHVTATGEYRRNQFSLLKGRPQNIVHRLEHRFHEEQLRCITVMTIVNNPVPNTGWLQQSKLLCYCCEIHESG
ncbi:hypothetical protein EAI_17058 [Harpegnathos saltator]|uniref:Uncharacterized protein n=1 Tax=Harpegnathos saltator TaxID=610380 RepID=E2B4F0_HARSA|nr:hypothetical protein EAI_17058 [Harpegnathos saltator]